jgi:hypothetical protein
MRKRTLLLGCLVLCASAPAPAAVFVYRATGEVTSVVGDTSLLPLAAEPGDDFTIEYTFDDSAPDTIPGDDNAGYVGIAYAVTIDGATVEYGTAPEGTSFVSIQRSGAFDLFGIDACLACEPGVTNDSARLNFYYPPDTLTSDALDLPLDATGTTSVQFGLFASQATPFGEAGVDVALETIELVPEPGAALLLATGALALSVRRRAAPRR